MLREVLFDEIKKTLEKRYKIVTRFPHIYCKEPQFRLYMREVEPGEVWIKCSETELFNVPSISILETLLTDDETREILVNVAKTMFSRRHVITTRDQNTYTIKAGKQMLTLKYTVAYNVQQKYIPRRILDMNMDIYNDPVWVVKISKDISRTKKKGKKKRKRTLSVPTKKRL